MLLALSSYAQPREYDSSVLFRFDHKSQKKLDKSLRLTEKARRKAEKDQERKKRWAEKNSKSIRRKWEANRKKDERHNESIQKSGAIQLAAKQKEPKQQHKKPRKYLRSQKKLLSFFNWFVGSNKNGIRHRRDLKRGSGRVDLR